MIEKSPPNQIITFYSYKGGTGRSMALANFAWLLALSGNKVLVIDWDLEAPGLHRYFRPFLVDPDLAETDGLIDSFWSMATMAARTENGMLSADQVADALDDGIRNLCYESFGNGSIDFIGAGRQDEHYSSKVSDFNWKHFFQVGGAAIITLIKNELRSRYNYVLIDSRTGVSDTAGICTIQIPDRVIACFTLNRQSIDGIAIILRSIRDFRSASVDGSEIRLFPLATRIENAERDRLEAARRYARERMAAFLPPLTSDQMPRDYWDAMEIAYRPAYAFEEVLAVFGDASGVAGAADTMLGQIMAMTTQITGFTTKNIEIPESERMRVLRKYALDDTLSNQAAQQAPPPHTVDGEIDAKFVEDLYKKEREWRQSDFNFNHLLDRRDLDMITQSDMNAFGRSMSYFVNQSRLMRKVEAVAGMWRTSTLMFALIAYALAASNFIIFRHDINDAVFFLVYVFVSVVCAFPLLYFKASIMPHGFTPIEFMLICIRGGRRSRR